MHGDKNDDLILGRLFLVSKRAFEGTERLMDEMNQLPEKSWGVVRRILMGLSGLLIGFIFSIPLIIWLFREEQKNQFRENPQSPFFRFNVIIGNYVPRPYYVGLVTGIISPLILAVVILVAVL